MNLLAKKPIDLIMSEANETGEHSLKRALGAGNLVSLGIGAIIGAGIFVLTGAAAAQYAGPAIVFSFILAGSGLRFCGALLRRVRVDDSRSPGRPTPTDTPRWARFLRGSSAGT